MPELNIKVVTKEIKDVIPFSEYSGFAVVKTVVHNVAILEQGTESGATSLALCFDLGNGKVLVAETTLKLLLGLAEVAAQADDDFPVLRANEGKKCVKCGKQLAMVRNETTGTLVPVCNDCKVCYCEICEEERRATNN